MSDLLNMDKLNALPQPLWAKIGGMYWPVYDIAVDAGLLRIDVTGLLQVETIGGVVSFRDAEGVEHCPDDFYNEDTP